MRIEIEIPEGFEEDFHKDKFKDALARLIVDAHCVAGKYEIEIADMLIGALERSKAAYDVDMVAEKVNQMLIHDVCSFAPEGQCKKMRRCEHCRAELIREVIKGGGQNG